MAIYLAVWLIPAIAGCLIVFGDNIPWFDSLLLAIGLSLPYAVVCLTPWYLCRMLPLRDEHLLKALLNHLAAAFISSVAWTTAVRFVTPQRLHQHLVLLFGTGVLLYLLSVAMHYVYFAVEDSKEAVLREQKAETLAREAELKALKAQINPHFLFNCLHSISALTTVDPPQAREMCIRLSDFLRNTLRLGEKELIPFAEELSLVNTYLAVEQVRFGSRLNVVRDVDAACERCGVPPLLLQPLIENSVKHGIAGLVEGGTIRLHASCSGQMLRIIVENDFDPDSPAPRKSGLGLNNVRNRIATRHGDRGRLDVTVTESSHRVELLIPCESLGRQERKDEYATDSRSHRG